MNNRKLVTANIHQLLFTTKSNRKYYWFWLLLSFAIAIFYSSLALQEAFNGNYVVQDDARQHIFWMYRYLDADFFPNDLIADYFQSVAPLGYKAVYFIPSLLGIDPVFVSKIIPGVLGLIMTGYCYAFSLELLPIPLAGFISALLLNQNLWSQDGLISGTPKAFILPLLLAFLYYFIRRSLLGMCIAIALFGLFYPSTVFICSGLLIIQLWSCQNGSVRLSNKRQDYIFCFVGLLVAFIVLLPYALSSSEYVPVITVEQARQLPEFYSGGRAAFFDDENLWDFWFNNSRSGIKLASALMPPLTYLAIILVVILNFPNTFTLSQKVSYKIKIFPQLILVSLGVFLIAHALLFKLHLPSRYTQHTLRIVMVLAGSIATAIIGDYCLRAITNNGKIKSTIAMVIALFLATLLIFYPLLAKNFIWTRYHVGNATDLYQFLQQQPQDTLIASLTSETDNLPSFTQRSILVSREYAIPYHTGYYFPYRQRAIDLITAQYSTDIEEVKKFIRKYNPDFWLVESNSFTFQYIEDNRWLKQHQPTAQNAITLLKQGKTPVLTNLQERCSVFSDDRYNLLAANCILNSN